jgi:predicted small lipoprotein YifL
MKQSYLNWKTTLALPVTAAFLLAMAGCGEPATTPPAQDQRPAQPADQQPADQQPREAEPLGGRADDRRPGEPGYGDRDYDRDDDRDFGERAIGAPDDHQLRAELESRFADSPELSGQMIQIDVQDGVAHLEGAVSSDAERDEAEQVAMTVEGIQSVRNNLTVEGEQR